MPTELPREPPTVWQGVQLSALLVLFHWYGYRRRVASGRMGRQGREKDYQRWRRAARRWLACSDKIAAILGGPEPPQVAEIRETLDLGDHEGSDAGDGA